MGDAPVLVPMRERGVRDAIGCARSGEEECAAQSGAVSHDADVGGSPDVRWSSAHGRDCSSGINAADSGPDLDRGRVGTVIYRKCDWDSPHGCCEFALSK